MTKPKGKTVQEKNKKRTYQDNVYPTQHRQAGMPTAHHNKSFQFANVCSK